MLKEAKFRYIYAEVYFYKLQLTVEDYKYRQLCGKHYAEFAD